MARPRILIVEDDIDWQEIYRRCLRGHDYEIATARRVNVALALLEDQLFEVVICDLKMLGGDEEFSGFGVLERARAIHPDVQVIVITGFGSADHALRAMGSGAYDYITKDRDLRKKLPLTVQGALEVRSLKEELLADGEENEPEPGYDRIIGNSASMQALFEQTASAAEEDGDVLIVGEESTGKQLIARTIHRRSARRQGPFEVVDCGRLSETMLEGELFGYEAGALYGVGESQPGKFERARGGTLFLDGIGDLDVRLQRRLAGVICDRIVERVGGKEHIPIDDVRVIASTDKDLEAMVKARTFERRLFDAFKKGAIIAVPPLRARRDGDDIPALAAMFAQRYGGGRPIQFSSEAIAGLLQYDYPGNVWELESAIKSALAVALDDEIRPEHLRPEIRNYQPPRPGQPKAPQAVKDSQTILRTCPLNLGACSKQDEIVRLYSPRRVFVNISYHEGYGPYEQAIRDALVEHTLVPVLSKDYLEPTVLLCNICKLIQTCKYGITDISEPQSNVLYELGLMHAIGVRCVILKERRAALSADIQGLLFLEYSSPESVSERLSRWIEDQVIEAKNPIEPSQEKGEPPMSELPPEVKAQAASFLFEIGRWAASELKERWTLARKKKGTQKPTEVDLSKPKEEVEQQSEALLQDVVAERGKAEVERVLGLIGRKRNLILEWKEIKVDNEEEANREMIARAALRLRQKELDDKIAQTMAQIETDLKELGIRVERAKAE